MDSNIIQDAPSRQVQQPFIQQAPEGPSKNWLKVLLLVLVAVLVLLAVAGGSYYLSTQKSFTSKVATKANSSPTSAHTPTPNLTANWQTYTSSTYSINYPNTWKMKADSFNPNFDSFYDPSSLVACNPNHCSGSLPTTYVNISTLASSETAKQYADRTTSNPLYKNQGSVETPVTFNGISGYIYKDAGEGSQGYIIVVSNGRTLVTINIPYGDITQDATISHMLQSFKFVE